MHESFLPRIAVALKDAELLINTTIMLECFLLASLFSFSSLGEQYT